MVVFSHAKILRHIKSVSIYQYHCILKNYYESFHVNVFQTEPILLIILFKVKDERQVHTANLLSKFCNTVVQTRIFCVVSNFKRQRTLVFFYLQNR